ncbi:MAG: hypothetical protein ACJ715_04675 [Ornithinibacter sp.]
MTHAGVTLARRSCPAVRRAGPFRASADVVPGHGRGKAVALVVGVAAGASPEPLAAWAGSLLVHGLALFGAALVAAPLVG